MQSPNGEPQTVTPSVAPSWVGTCMRLSGEMWTPAIVFRQREGKRFALAYSYLSAIRYDPEGVIEIEFVGNQVRIDGVRLLPVFEQLVFQRIAELAEHASDFDEDGSSPLIRTIVSVASSEH